MTFFFLNFEIIKGEHIKKLHLIHIKPTTYPHNANLLDNISHLDVYIKNYVKLSLYVFKYYFKINYFKLINLIINLKKCIYYVSKIIIF